MKKQNINEVDKYIEQFESKTKEQLIKMREILRKAVPDATERMGNKMPAFYLHGNLVYYAAYKNYIGFYAFSETFKEFNDEVSKHDYTKGSIKFPIDKTLPVKLISKIAKFRAEEN